MEAVLLMCDVLGVALVLLWAARGQGRTGLLAWRDNIPAKSKQED